MKGFT